MSWGPRCYQGEDPGNAHCKERPTEARKGGAAHRSTSSPASPTAVRGHLWSVPSSPAHRQDGDLALASGLGPSLGGPGWVGQESGGRSGGSCSLRGQQHLGPLLLATTGAAGARERGQALHGVEVLAMRANVRHAGRARRQPVGNTGGRVTGRGRPRRPRRDRRGNAPQGRVTGRQAEYLLSGARLPAHLGRGRWLVCTSCRLWYSFSSSSSAAAFSVGSCSQNLALGSQGGPAPAPAPCPLTPPQGRPCAFSSPAHRARKGAAPPATRSEGQAARGAPAGGAEQRSGAGMGPDLPPHLSSL